MHHSEPFSCHLPMWQFSCTLTHFALTTAHVMRMVLFDPDRCHQQIGQHPVLYFRFLCFEFAGPLPIKTFKKTPTMGTLTTVHMHARTRFPAICLQLRRWLALTPLFSSRHIRASSAPLDPRMPTRGPRFWD